MSVLLELAFAVGLGKYFWDRNKSSMIVGVLSTLLLPKESPHKHSKAERTASRTLVMPYIYRDSQYEMILPTRSKPLGWTHCWARMSNGSVKEVSEIVSPKSGPFRDFYGMKFTASQLVRGATQLTFFHESGKELLRFE
jgi:hypothetical protein